MTNQERYRLNQLIEFTGSMLIGSDAMGRVNLLPQFCSRTYELTSDNGQLIEKSDRNTKI